MASWSKALVPSTLDSSSPFFTITNSSRPISFFCKGLASSLSFKAIKLSTPSTYSSLSGNIQPPPSFSLRTHICRAAEYEFPEPIPEFAEAETEKFRTHLLTRLAKKKDLFDDSLEEVVDICTQIFSTFLHTEYGGPGTLLVTPFADMADAITEEGLSGAPQAARAAIVWAQNHIDKDWKEWTGDSD